MKIDTETDAQLMRETGLSGREENVRIYEETFPRKL